MKKVRNSDLSDRLSASSAAKQALLKAHAAAKDAAEPTRLAKLAERAAVAAARDERRAALEKAKLAERERAAAEAAEQQAAIDNAAKAEIEAREQAENNRIARVISDEAERKAERDRRYAARKARQK